MKGIVDPKTLIEAKRLLLVSPEEVYRYLEERKDDEILYQLAEVLLERNDELINLAIARFTNNEGVLESLFKASTDEAIRCAALGNPEFPLGFFRLVEEQHTDLINVLEKGTQAEVHALVTNASLDGDSLASIFRREGWAGHLSDDRWFLCSILALNNPNLKSQYKSRAPIGYGEGYESYQHNKAIEGAWSLLLNAPLTKEWAINLSDQLAGNKIFHYYGADETFYKKVFVRWVSDSEELEKSFKDLRMWIASTVPTHLDKLHEWMANHDDQAIRIGHYYSFNTHDEKELDKYYEKDSKEFIDAALQNEHLFINKKIREYLKELVNKNCEERGWYDDLDFFDIALERISKIRPDILPDEDRQELEFQEGTGHCWRGNSLNSLKMV
ncbi:MAG: hypothetical protein ACE5JU_24690, partial [Candidatus Binatia bacterium]